MSLVQVSFVWPVRRAALSGGTDSRRYTYAIEVWYVSPKQHRATSHPWVCRRGCVRNPVETAGAHSPDLYRIVTTR